MRDVTDSARRTQTYVLLSENAVEKFGGVFKVSGALKDAFRDVGCMIYSLRHEWTHFFSSKISVQ